jgi:hypothetical protein
MRGKIMLVLLLAVALAAPAGAAKKPLHPVGRITFEGTSMGVGATFSWGRGWLTFKGKRYPIKVEGLGLVGLGFTRVKAHGTVYHLRKPMEITGTYAKAGAGIALVGGAKGFVAKNEQGVVIELTAEQQGVSFNLGGGTFTITLTSP